MNHSFERFLKNEKKLTLNGVNSRLSRLKWVEDTCRMNADEMVKSVEVMLECREKIYSIETDGHKAGNYYNALRLYYEYVHGKECPRINNSNFVKNLFW